MNLELFPRYVEFDPLVPVYCATPKTDRVIHRFFDSSPISPGGRYLAVTRFPFEDRSPRPGDSAEVVLVDLDNGTEHTVASTIAWGSQLGAQVQWGATDRDLFFNEMDTQTWTPRGKVYDPETGESRQLDGPVYDVSRDGRFSVNPSLAGMARTQLGYGVMVPDKLIPVNRGAESNDGVFLLDCETGLPRLLLSIKALVDALPELRPAGYEAGDYYVFHTRFSPDARRIMVVLRWAPRLERRWWRKVKPASKKSMRKYVVTIAADGTDPHVVISDDLWSRGGHHPHWHPDSQHITMNLDLHGEGLRFISAAADGSGIKLLHSTATGSGHPSIHPESRYLLTDTYPGEPTAYGDGTVPIRLLDLQTGEERALARMHSRPLYIGDRKEMRLDAHPTWDRSGQYIVFNGYAGGTRRVYIADVGKLISVGIEA